MTYESNPSPMPFVIGRVSDAGRSGKNNEDSADDFRAQLATQQNGSSLTVPIQVAVVADGIGGNVAGETASRMAVDTIREFFRNREMMAVSGRLVAAIEEANQRIYERAIAEPELGGMGTTVVAAAIEESRLYVAHAGDSRAYLLRNGHLFRLTLDHTWAQEAIEAGRLTPAQAKDHPNRHVIKRFLGISDVVDVDSKIVDVGHSLLDPEQIHEWPKVDVLTMQPGDRVVLCSDGLTDVVDDTQIADLTGRHAPQEAAQRLVDQANKAGGPDNITVVIVQWSDGTQPATIGAVKRSPTVAIGLVLAAIAIIAAAYFALTGGAVSESAPASAMVTATAIANADGVKTGGVITSEAENAATLVSNSNTAAAPVDASAVEAATETPTALPTATDLPTETPEPTATVAPPTSTPIDGTPAATTSADTETTLSTITGTPNPENLAATGAENIGNALADPNGTPNPENDENAMQAVVTGRTTTSSGITDSRETSGGATSTPVPDFSPTPTLTATPVPSNTPTSAPVATQRATVTVTSSPIGATTTTGSNPAEFAGASVTLLEPNNGDTLDSRRLFSWSTSYHLAENQAYEVLFWQPGQVSESDGRGVAGSIASTSVNIAPEQFQGIGLREGEYQWAVYLVTKSPYQKLRMLSEPRQIFVDFPNDSSNGNCREGLNC